MRRFLAVLMLAAVATVGLAGLGLLAVLGDGGSLVTGPRGELELGVALGSGRRRLGGDGGSQVPNARWVRLARVAASTCPGLPWEVLVAIGKVETDWGEDDTVSSAGAEGPMQFLPSTWAEYGAPFGEAAIWRLRPSLFAAAALLCANGGGRPTTLFDAIWAYNHSAHYVEAVLDLAERYEAEDHATTGRAIPGLRSVFTSSSAKGDITVAQAS